VLIQASTYYISLHCLHLQMLKSAVDTSGTNSNEVPLLENTASIKHIATLTSELVKAKSELKMLRESDKVGKKAVTEANTLHADLFILKGKATSMEEEQKNLLHTMQWNNPEDSVLSNDVKQLKQSQVQAKKRFKKQLILSNVVTALVAAASTAAAIVFTQT
jgi:hypothetical protein